MSAEDTKPLRAAAEGLLAMAKECPDLSRVQKALLEAAVQLADTSTRIDNEATVEIIYAKRQISQAHSQAESRAMFEARAK
jgi:hypothetical protein